jgi:Bifunctional DNA primase/polymerase, N-terminal
MLLLEDRRLPCFFVTPAKVPFACTHGFLDATADPDELKKLAARCHGPKLIAVATGAISGIDILDIDPRRGGGKWYFEHHDQLTKTRVHESRSGGWHLIWKHSLSLRNSADKIAPGVEFLSTGRYAVFWPAHTGRVLCEGPVAPLPAWLHEKLRDNGTRNNDLPTQQKDGPQMTGAMAEIKHEIPNSLYNEVLRLIPLSPKVTRHHRRRVIGILRDIVIARHEPRNDGLNIGSYCFRELINTGIVSRDAAEQLLFGAAQVWGYVAKDGDRKAIATIRSGLGSPIGGPSFSG